MRGRSGLLICSSHPTRQSLICCKILQLVHALGQQRFGKNGPDLTEAAIVREYNRHPLQVRGFFQSLGGTRTPEMLLMVWRIIQGMAVRDVKISYRKRERFEVRVILESPYGEEDQPYVSNSIQDFALFRHIGIMESGGPIFDGFYALKVR